MEQHAASFLSCPRVARWLTDPRPPAFAHEELLTKARTVHLWRCPPSPLGHATAPCSEPETMTYVAADVCEAHGHVLCFVTGAVLGAPDDALRTSSATTRLVLDAGRRAAMLFEHCDNGSTTVALDCFDEAGDSYSDVRYFASRAGAPAGSFPETLVSACKVLRKRDCPPCTKSARVCECEPRVRLDLLLKEARRARRQTRSTIRSKDGRVTSACYPAWQQALDAYVDSHIGNYVIQVQHTPICSATKPAAYQLAYRARYAAAPHAVSEMKVREITLGGVTPLLPRRSGPVYYGPRTVSVDARNMVSSHREPQLVDQLRNLPGFRYDYLLGISHTQIPPVPESSLSVVHCENANKCHQPANMCLSFGALLKPVSVAAECTSLTGCATAATIAQSCDAKNIVPKSFESQPNSIELSNTNTKLPCDEPRTCHSRIAKALPTAPLHCNLECLPPSVKCPPMASKTDFVKFTDIQCHMLTVPSKRPRATSASLDERSSKRRCSSISSSPTPQQHLNGTALCAATQANGRYSVPSPTPVSNSYLNSRSESPGTSWDDFLSSGSGSAVSAGCAKAEECCPPVAVRDEWELPSRAAAHAAAAPAASVVCPPSIRDDSHRPPSPYRSTSSYIYEIADTITGDVKEVSNGGVRESNQQALIKWLTRETPMSLPPPLTLI